jgi:hypothetical protein
MKRIRNLLFIGIFSVLICSACGSAEETIPPYVIPTASPQPTFEVTLALPTPSSPGNSITWNNLQVTMDQAEVTSGYSTEYGSNREPPAGSKFLWVHIRLNNVGQSEHSLPAPEHFSALFGASEFKPTYGHRKGFTDYTALPDSVYQGQKVDAWLRFDIPTDATLSDLLFAFLPESLQLSTSFSATVSPWGDHPIYLWKCTQ